MPEEITDTLKDFLATGDLDKALKDSGLEPSPKGGSFQETYSTELGSAETSSGDNNEDGQELEHTSESPEHEASQTEVATDGNEGKEAHSDWRNEGVKEYARSYGISDEDLGDFDSEAEFRKATRLIDKKLAAGAQETQGQIGGQQAAPEDDQQVEAEARGLPLDPQAYREAGFDDDVVKLVEHLAETQKQLAGHAQFIEAQARAMAVQSYQAEIDAFHDALDVMDETRYGRSIKDGSPVDLNKPQDDARREIFGAINVLKEGIVAQARKLGQEPELPPMKILVQRAEAMVFGDQLREQERKTVQRELAKQSKTRRPVGNARPSQQAARPVNENEMNPASVIANLPQMVEFWDSLGS